MPRLTHPTIDGAAVEVDTKKAAKDWIDSGWLLQPDDEPPADTKTPAGDDG